MKFTDISKLLGKPYFQSCNCLIYNLDCLEAMAILPDQSINLTVTSPPYNIGKEYENLLPLDDYINWCEKWITEVYRLTLYDGAFWLNLGYLSIKNRAKAIPISYLLWDKIPFYLIQEIVWNYGAGVAGSKFFSPRNEKFLWYVKNPEAYTFNLDDIRDPNVKYPNQKKNGKIKVNPLGKNPTDVWEFPKVTSGQNRSSKERTPHPAQFPSAVIQRIITASSHENEIVLDPFLGSGTTAMVALDLNRLVIGFEIRQDYCDIAANRIETFLQDKNSRIEQLSLLW
ncbi:DNA-methyltransferase [Dolichospermum circinale]|uniref:DNA-methyltransferase n=1 Tax=Dolichospermum circinale TaxID=109265 RepID=UPI0004889D29|nr:site-specific DNA-methyltransferase [Dolichospermum circinale]MDB9481370.1 site-specific DNA-methyltransferase [Dolichospermum circinale CS-537/05]MDB9454008.1 site-specific DNA-methyltransferase [Dolichospermum circinale CS-541/06]MDB9463183.1 site-specific DNA-methyltransferase [Dolichospermum circinale CS-541/04]MDB9473899.1 site-specific DNA-methyltransferase [Dolichospermum circinale CS-537/11]MDB9479311.1 site-specific DNA-methyltransferase [Dolichospermum circinale CS-537/03]